MASRRLNSWENARKCNDEAATRRLAVSVAREELGKENKELRERVAELEAEVARMRELSAQVFCSCNSAKRPETILREIIEELGIGQPVLTPEQRRRAECGVHPIARIEGE